MWRSLLFAALLIASPVHAQDTQTEAATAPGPALWETSDEDTRIIMLGTVHVLPAELEWMSPEIEAAIEEADTLVVETDTNASPFRLLGLFAEVAVNKDLPPVRDRLPAELHDEFDAVMKDAFFPERVLDILETWAVAELIDSEVEIPYESGAERQLESLFQLAGKPIDFLETITFQVQMSKQYSPALQAALLRSSLQTHDMDAVAMLDALIETWKSGAELDATTLAAVVDMEEGVLPPALDEEHNEILLYARNRNWADWVEQRLERPGTVLLAVGAAHLAGDRSLQDYLEQRGIETRRIN